MAAIVYVNTSNSNGNRVLGALQQIRSGLATLHELDGLRAESIAAGAATMASNFGAIDNDDAQALSDRWVNLLAALYDDGNVDYDAFAKLRDLIDAVTAAP